MEQDIQEILLTEHIQVDIQQRFAVELEIEPNVITG